MYASGPWFSNCWCNRKCLVRESSCSIGLWKKCLSLVGCYKRTLFQFDQDGSKLNLDFDIILVTLCASAVLCCIAAFSTIFMFCCQRSPGAWRCCALLVAMVSIFGALCALGAVGFNEEVGRNLYKVYDHGWSNVLVWVSGVLQLCGSIFAYILICLAPNRVSQGGVIIQPPQHNRGFELH